MSLFQTLLQWYGFYQSTVDEACHGPAHRQSHIWTINSLHKSTTNDTGIEFHNIARRLSKESPEINSSVFSMVA